MVDAESPPALWRESLAITMPQQRNADSFVRVPVKGTKFTEVTTGTAGAASRKYVPSGP